MKILVAAPDVPRPDQSSGELRLFTLLSILSHDHEVSFYSGDQRSEPERDAAISRLRDSTVSVERGPLERVLRSKPFDIVLFEFYFFALGRIELTRAWLPNARVIVDTVDVHFHRLQSRAALTQLPADLSEADRVREDELDAYGNADLVLTVSDEDRIALREVGLLTPIAILPNIHAIYPLSPTPPRQQLELVFVGSYRHAPNIDAMQYFCRDIMPLIRARVPKVRLRIVGSAPTAEVFALAAPDIEVLGFVQETGPVLQSSHISIAPLRFGGGIKGKIGEAMAYGLPVISTSVGAEGFGFLDGRELIVADCAESFASAIGRLWDEPETYERVRRAGREWIASRLSVSAVSALLPPILATVQTINPKRLGRVRRIRTIAPFYADKHLLWRFRR